MIALSLQCRERTRFPRGIRSFAPFNVGIEALRTNERRMGLFVSCSFFGWRGSDSSHALGKLTNATGKKGRLLHSDYEN